MWALFACVALPYSLVAQVLFFIVAMSISYPSATPAFELLSSVQPVVWALIVVWPVVLVSFSELLKQREHRSVSCQALIAGVSSLQYEIQTGPERDLLGRLFWCTLSASMKKQGSNSYPISFQTGRLPVGPLVASFICLGLLSE